MVPLVFALRKWHPIRGQLHPNSCVNGRQREKEFLILTKDNMNSIYTKIGEKIADLRINFGGKGISQEALAKAVKTTPNTISRWEKSVYKPSADDLFKLAKFFGVSISVFFPDMTLNPKQEALLSATGELDGKAMDDLIEYAKFRKARQVLKDENSK